MSQSKPTKNLDLQTLLRSSKFRAWHPKVVHRKAKSAKFSEVVPHKESTSEETIVSGLHFSPTELAKAWGVSTEMIRQIFRVEPGVLKLGKSGTKYRRGYFTLRIPEQVAKRVHRRLSA